MFGVNRTEILGELQEKKNKLSDIEARMEGLADNITRRMWEWHQHKRLDGDLAGQAMRDIVAANREREQLLTEISRLEASL